MFKYENKNKRYSQRKKAFSFMEVILVVAIIGIMTSIVLTFVGRSKHNTELEVAANEIVASIRKIQNYALSGKNISPECSNYRFTTVSGTNKFYIDSDSSGPSCFYKSYKLKNDIIFSNISKIKFNAPFANRDNSNTVDIVIVKDSYSYHICVTGVGVITMQSNAC